MKKNFGNFVLSLCVVMISVILFSCKFNEETKTVTEKTVSGSITGKVIYSNLTEEKHGGILVTLDKTDGLRTEAVNDISAGRSIESSERSLAGTVTTSSDGSYTFNNLAPGTYTVYATSTYSNTKAVCPNIVVRAGETTDAEELSLTATGSIAGTITIDEASSGNMGFVVFVAGTSYLAITDDAGKYMINDIPAGNSYMVVATKDGVIHLLSTSVSVGANETTTVAPNIFTSTELKEAVKGEKGDKGDAGDPGEKGDKGDPGDPGQQGDKGDPGDPGEKGEPGDPGADGTNGENGKDGLSIVWLGAFDSEADIKKPEALNAYFNKTDGCSYIYNGKEWTLLASAGAKGEPGEQGLKGNDGDAGADGVTVIWKGELSAAPAEPKIYWAYYNKTNGCSYIYNGTEWNLLAKAGTDGVDGVNGVTIIWRGELDEAPSTAQPYWAYYNKTDGCSYIYVNGKWSLLARNGKDGTGTGGNEPNHVSAVATDKGIKFWGSILNNTHYTDRNMYYYYDGYNSYPNESTSTNPTTASATITIKENNSKIEMVYNYMRQNDWWEEWNLTYPLVENGKEYSFTVKADYGGFTIYEEDFTVTATGGLGEFKIENASEYGLELTEDRVFKRTGKAVYTDNPDVKVIREGIQYELYRGKNSKDTWVFDTSLHPRWLDTTDGTAPLKNASSTYQAWLPFESINRSLSGCDYTYSSYTQIQIAGYTYDGDVVFKMNDYIEKSDFWGGEKVKKYVTYGIRIEDRYNSRKEIDKDGKESNYDMSTEFINSSKDIEKVLNEYKLKLSDMPGTETTIVFKNNGPSQVTITNYAYADIIDYVDSVNEPEEKPVLTSNNEESSIVLRFKEWVIGEDKTNQSHFPSTNIYWDANNVYYVPLYAVFEVVPPAITAKFMMNDGTDTVFETFICQPGDGDYGHYDVPLEKPVREGYEFLGWYYPEEDGYIPRQFYGGYSDYCGSDLTLYAKWKEILISDNFFTVTFMDGDKELAVVKYYDNEVIDLQEAKFENSKYYSVNWYVDPECTIPFEYSAATSNVTVYAGWSENKNFVEAPKEERPTGTKTNLTLHVENKNDPECGSKRFQRMWRQLGIRENVQALETVITIDTSKADTYLKLVSGNHGDEDARYTVVEEPTSDPINYDTFSHGVVGLIFDMQLTKELEDAYGKTISYYDFVMLGYRPYDNGFYIEKYSDVTADFFEAASNTFFKEADIFITDTAASPFYVYADDHDVKDFTTKGDAWVTKWNGELGKDDDGKEYGDKVVPLKQIAVKITQEVKGTYKINIAGKDFEYTPEVDYAYINKDGYRVGGAGYFVSAPLGTTINANFNSNNYGTIMNGYSGGSSDSSEIVYPTDIFTVGEANTCGITLRDTMEPFTIFTEGSADSNIQTEIDGSVSWIATAAGGVGGGVAFYAKSSKEEINLANYDSIDIEMIYSPVTGHWNPKAQKPGFCMRILPYDSTGIFGGYEDLEYFDGEKMYGTLTKNIKITDDVVNRIIKNSDFDSVLGFAIKFDDYSRGNANGDQLKVQLKSVKFNAKANAAADKAFDDGLTDAQRGTVVEINYPTRDYSIDAANVTNADKYNKHAWVYLPAGYNANDKNTKYPVFILLHGFGQNENTWGLSDQGRGGKIKGYMDRGMASGEVRKFILVVANGVADKTWGPNGSGYNYTGYNYFGGELRNDLLPYLRENYNIADGRDNVALAGLSMGGGQTFNIGIGECLDLISNFAGFSGALFSTADEFTTKVDGTAVFNGLKIHNLYMICGDADSLVYGSFPGYVDAMKAWSRVENFESYVYPGGTHDFPVWYRGFKDFIQMVFQEGVQLYTD